MASPFSGSSGCSAPKSSCPSSLCPDRCDSQSGSDVSRCRDGLEGQAGTRVQGSGGRARAPVRSAQPLLWLGSPLAAPCRTHWMGLFDARGVTSIGSCSLWLASSGAARLASSCPARTPSLCLLSSAGALALRSPHMGALFMKSPVEFELVVEWSVLC